MTTFINTITLFLAFYNEIDHNEKASCLLVGIRKRPHSGQQYFIPTGMQVDIKKEIVTS